MIKVNEYFSGKVKSLGIQTGEGPATVGVAAPGEYEFGTSTVEVMKVISGKFSVRLPGSAAWKDFGEGEGWTVGAGEKFQVRTAADSAYICWYK
jgi:hypothetical protein